MQQRQFSADVLMWNADRLLIVLMFRSMLRRQSGSVTLTGQTSEDLCQSAVDTEKHDTRLTNKVTKITFLDYSSWD